MDRHKTLISASQFGSVPSLSQSARSHPGCWAASVRGSSRFVEYRNLGGRLTRTAFLAGAWERPFRPMTGEG